MSDFSVKNRDNINTANIQIQKNQNAEKKTSQAQEDNLKEGLSLHKKIKNLSITKGNSIEKVRSQLMTLEDSIRNKGGSKTLLKEQKLFFLTNLENTLISNILTKQAPHLMQLQMKAADCDLNFKEKCLSILDGNNNLNTQGNVYKSAKTSEQKAFLDLMFAFKFTSSFCNQFAKENQTGADSKLQMQLQGLMGELLSCEEKDIDKAKANLLELLNNLPADRKLKETHALNEFKNKINAIAENKKTVASEIKKLHEEYKQAIANLKNVNPETLKFTTLSYNKSSQTANVPSMCGISSLIEGEVLGELKKEIEQDLKPRIDNLKKIAKDIELTFKAKNLKGLTLSNLRKRLEGETENTYLKQKIENYSREAFEKIGGRIVSLLDNPLSNINLASELTKIGDMIGRELLEEHSKPLSKILSLNLAKIPVQSDSLDSTQNLKTLKSILNTINSDDNLLNHFPDIIRTLTLNQFDLKSFAILGGAKKNDSYEITSAKCTEVIERICSILDGKENGAAFIDRLADNIEQSGSSSDAFAAVASVLSQSHDELLSQKCGKYLNLNLIKQAAKLDLEKGDLQHWNIPPTPEELKANPQQYEDFILEQKLIKILNGKPSEIDSSLLKDLLDAAVLGKLKHCRTIWNSILGAAYHTEMATKLERNEISRVPKQIYSITAEESSPDIPLLAPANYSGENARKDFQNSLSDNVKKLMKTQSFGLFRKESQSKNVDEITSKLNSLNDGKILKAMSNESMAGKKMLCLDEMRKELIFINQNILKGGTSQFRDIADPEKLLHESIDKSVLMDEVNSKYKGIGEKFSSLIKSRNEVLQNPVLSQLLAAQGLEPGQIPKGEDVAVTLVTLRDNLIDDLDLLDNRALKAIGIEHPEKLSLTSEDYSFGKELNNYLAKQHMLIANGIDTPPSDPRFSADKIAEFEKKCDELLLTLKNRITQDCRVKPLSKTAKLLLSKYVQITALRYGDSYSQFIAKDKGTAFILKNGDSETNIKKAQQLTFEENVKINAKLTSLSSGNLKTDDKELVAIEKLILNDLCQQLGFNDEEETSLYAAVTEDKLSFDEKKELIASIKLLPMNVNLDSFEAADPRDSQKTSFSDDLRNLNNTLENDFNEKLKNFAGSYLFSEKMTQADALISYINHGVDKTEATKQALSSAYTQTALTQNNTLKKISNDFENNYGEKLGSVQEKASVFSKALSEQIYTVGDKLLGNLAVRSQVRLAASYAAAQLGYSGKDELIEAYQSNEISIEEKNKILSEMVLALNERGLDRNLSTILAMARLREGKHQNILARTWTFVRNKMFNGLAKIQSAFSKLNENDLARIRRKRQEFTTYLPAVTEMVNSIGKDNVKYFDNDKEFKLTIKPFDVTDAIASTGLQENGVVTLKLALSLMNKSGMVLNREQNGKINLAVNTSTIFGATATADIDLIEACGASAEANGNIGGGKVLNLKFDSDDEAAVFICKMFTGQLTADDVRLANEATTGTIFQAGTEIGIDAKAGAALNLAAFNEESAGYSDTITDPEEEFAKNHPILDTVMSNADIADLKLSGGYKHESKTVTDNSGVLTETHRQWKVETEFSSFAFAGKYQVIANETSEVLKNGIEPLEKISDHKDNIDGKINELLNKPLKAMGINYGENYHTVHTSDITGSIDYATDTTVTTALSDKELENLKAQGFINETLENQLKESESDIVKVSQVMRLKQSVIDRYQNDPKALARAAKDVKKNYELISFSVEISDSEKKVEHYDFANLISIGFVSYSSSATAKGTTVIKIEKSKL